MKIFSLFFTLLLIVYSSVNCSDIIMKHDKYDVYTLIDSVKIDLKTYRSTAKSTPNYYIKNYEPIYNDKGPYLISQLCDKNDKIIWEKGNQYHGDIFSYYLTTNSGNTIFSKHNEVTNKYVIQWIGINGDTLNTLIDSTKGVESTIYPIADGNKWLLVKAFGNNNHIVLDSNLILFDGHGNNLWETKLNYSDIRLTSRNDDIKMFIVSARYALQEDEKSGSTFFIDYDGEIINRINTFLVSGLYSNYAEDNGIYIDNNSNIVDISNFRLKFLPFPIGQKKITGTKSKTGLFLISNLSNVSVINFQDFDYLFAASYNNRISNIYFSEDGTEFSFTSGNTLLKYKKRE